MLLSDLIPVATSRMDGGEAEVVCQSKDIVVIDEPSSEPGVVNWKTPEDEWTFPVDRVVGEQFLYTRLEMSTRNSRLKAWRHSIVHLRITGTTAVLYTYSDCTLLRSAAGRASSAYGWLAAGCADAWLVKEVPSDGSGHWHLSQLESEWDLNTLEESTWKGGVIDGPSSELTTFRGEAFGLLATLQYVKIGR